MPIRKIRMIAFLTLAVLAAGYSCTKCSCSCQFHGITKYDNVCDWINKLQTSDHAENNTITKIQEQTKGIITRFEEMEVQVMKVVKNISNAVAVLRSKLENVGRQVGELKNNTSKRFKETANERNKAKQESDRQKNALDKKLRNLESLSEEAQFKWIGQETKIRNLEQEIAVKKEEDRRTLLKVRTEFMERVEEAERNIKTVLGKLRDSVDTLGKNDRFIEEQIQKVNDAVAELSSTTQEAAISLTEQEKKSKMLKSKMKKVKNTVSSLITYQSELKEEFRTNLSFSIERLKTNVENRFIELKYLGGNLTAKINRTEENQLLLVQELSKCAPLANLSNLDRAVREHTRTSSLEHQSLRSEMRGNVTKLREQCAARDDVNEIKQNIDSLSTEVNRTQGELQWVARTVSEQHCRDIAPKYECDNKVKQQLCREEKTWTECCASCHKQKLYRRPSKRPRGK